MKRVGYHSILLRNGKKVAGPLVVETDEKGCLLSWHFLLREEPSVEWRGGTFKE